MRGQPQAFDCYGPTEVLLHCQADQGQGSAGSLTCVCPGHRAFLSIYPAALPYPAFSHAPEQQRSIQTPFAPYCLLVMASNRPRSPSDQSFETRSHSREDEQRGQFDSTRSPQDGYPNSHSDRRPANDRDLARDGQHTERVSLLRSSEESSPARYSGDDEDDDARRALPGTPTVLAIIIAASALILVLDVVAAAPTAPRMVIFEDIICRNHYASLQDGGGGTVNCKIEPVQSELALINGWKETFDTIPGTCRTVHHAPIVPPPYFYPLINLPRLKWK
jgi:hypothetical protein